MTEEPEEENLNLPVEPKVYLVDVTVEIPFEHDTEEMAEQRGRRICDYALQALPGCVATYSVWAKIPDADMSDADTPSDAPDDSET